MASVNNTSNLGVQIETQQISKDERENVNLAGGREIQPGSHVGTRMFTSTAEQNSFDLDVSANISTTVSGAKVGKGFILFRFFQIQNM